MRNSLKSIAHLIFRGWRNEARRQHDINETVIVSKCGASLEKNYGGVINPVYRDELLVGWSGLRCHDGSYKFFKWNNELGCMVPFEMSNQTAT
jgi:hypothetical protein